MTLREDGDGSPEFYLSIISIQNKVWSFTDGYYACQCEFPKINVGGI
jgi:hypothetical protein